MRQVALNTEVPALAHGHADVKVHQCSRRIVTVGVSKSRRRAHTERNSGRDCWIVKRIHHRSLEGWVAASISEKVIENAIVKDSVSSTNRSLAIAPRIPGEPDARFEVLVVILVHIPLRISRSHHCEGIGRSEAVS